MYVRDYQLLTVLLHILSLMLHVSTYANTTGVMIQKTWYKTIRQQKHVGMYVCMYLEEIKTYVHFE